MTWLTRVSDLLAGRKTPTVRAHLWDDSHEALTSALAALTRSVYGSGGLVAGSVTAAGTVLRVRDVLAVTADSGAVCVVQSTDLDAAGVPALRLGAVVVVPQAQTVTRTYQSGKELVTDTMAVSLGRAVLLYGPDDQSGPVLPANGVAVARFRRTAGGVELLPDPVAVPTLRHARAQAARLADLAALLTVGSGLQLALNANDVRVSLGGADAPYSPVRPPYLSTVVGGSTVRAASAHATTDDSGVTLTGGGDPARVLRLSAAVAGDVNTITAKLTLAYGSGTLPLTVGVYALNGDDSLGALLTTGRGISAGVFTTAVVDFALDAPITLPARVALVWDAAQIPADRQLRWSTAAAANWIGGLSNVSWSHTGAAYPALSFENRTTNTRNVLGPLSPDALPVKTAALSLNPGEGYLLSAPGAVPEWRFKRADGTEYKWVGVPV